uniref:Uncharacterized protein n=1 Tax=Triticum urartu TaxID=4572 RepID=A0A8R7PL95_TRIUA
MQASILSHLQRDESQKLWDDLLRMPRA